MSENISKDTIEKKKKDKSFDIIKKINNKEPRKNVYVCMHVC